MKTKETEIKKFILENLANCKKKGLSSKLFLLQLFDYSAHACEIMCRKILDENRDEKLNNFATDFKKIIEQYIKLREKHYKK